MNKDAILEQQILDELKKDGAIEKDEERQVATGYTTLNYKIIEYKGLKFEINSQEDNDLLWDDFRMDESVLLVNYHRDFTIENDNIITEDETRQLYLGCLKLEKLEKEKGYWIFELSCLIHSGVWLQFGGGGFSSDGGGWDTSRVGLVLVSKKTAKTRKEAEEYGENLVDRYNKVLSGDIYYIDVSKDGKELDGCSCIIGMKDVYKYIKEYTSEEV